MLIADRALSQSASEMHFESTIGATCPKRRAMIVGMIYLAKALLIILCSSLIFRIVIIFVLCLLRNDHVHFKTCSIYNKAGCLPQRVFYIDQIRQGPFKTQAIQRLGSEMIFSLCLCRSPALIRLIYKQRRH